MTSLAARMHAHALALPGGTLLRAQDFLHLGSRPAVQKALSQASRLSGEHALARVARGTYVRLVPGFGGAWRHPSANEIVNQLSQSGTEVIATGGAHCANGLRLSTQMPCISVFWTSGSSRRLLLGKLPVVFTHVPDWKLLGAGRPAGAVLRALAYFGPSTDMGPLLQLQRMLPTGTFEELRSFSPQVPKWMQDAIHRASQTSV